MLPVICSSRSSSKDEGWFNGCEISHCPTSLDPFSFGTRVKGDTAKGN